MPRKASPRSATTPLAECSCPLPWNCRAQPSCPTIVIPSAGRLPRQGWPGWRRRRVDRGGFLLGEEGPGPFDSQGRGGIESPDFPSLGSLLVCAQGGHERTPTKIPKRGSRATLYPL